MRRNITLSADKRLIEQARERARQRNTTLNEEFRRWLEGYAGQSRATAEYEALMNELDYVRAGRAFTRHELNER